MNALVPEFLEAARLSAAAYVDDRAAREAAIAALSLSAVDTYENGDHRALLCGDGRGRFVLVLCGTRFSDGNLHELFDDEDVLPVELPFGLKVMAGFHAGMADLYKWALDRLPAAAPIELTGHSLGGARAHLAPLFIDPPRIRQITSFGAPKAANRAYWATYAGVPLRRVVNGRDLWAGYPWLGDWVQPAPLYWLDARPSGGAEILTTTEDRWPGGIRAGDHSIDSGYCKNLAAIAAASAAVA